MEPLKQGVRSIINDRGPARPFQKIDIVVIVANGKDPTPLYFLAACEPSGALGFRGPVIENF